jgi:hypothetical protein
VGSEDQPDPAEPLRARVPHQDLDALTLPEACWEVVICNEIIEQLRNLPLRCLARTAAFLAASPFSGAIRSWIRQPSAAFSPRRLAVLGRMDALSCISNTFMRLSTFWPLATAGACFPARSRSCASG